MKQNKMAAVREVLATNPDATPAEIVSALAKQKIVISLGVVSNYKSVIKSGAKRGAKRGRPAKAASPAAPKSTPASNGSKIPGLDPAVVNLLKAGKTLGWKKVQSIVELMSGAY